MKTHSEIYKEIEAFTLKKLKEIKHRSEIDAPPQGWEWLQQFEKGHGINIACGNNPMTESFNIDLSMMLGNLFGDRMPGDDLYSIKSNSLDYVLCNCPEVFPTPTKLFNEWYRVLKSGGICAIVTINGDMYEFEESPLTSRRNSIFTLKTLNFYLKKAGFSHKYSELDNKMIKMVVEKV